MKIKYQSGGMITYTPFIPQSGTSSGSGSDGDKKNKISGTLQEKIIDVLKESGIQSDVDSFLSEANTFLTKSQHLSNMSIFGGSDDDYSMTDLIGVLSMANKVKQNKLQWDAAAVNLKDEDAWDEVAMTSTGSIYVVKDGKLSTVTSQDYYQNRDKYQALTTAQVMGLRESDPNMAFKEDVLKDMSGMISFKTITDHLVNTIDKFGSNSREEYIKKTGEDVPQSVWNGMRILIENGPDGYYKVKTQSELTNVNAALNYLMQTLGKKGRARLAAEIAVSGGDPSKDSANLIMQALQMHTQFSQSANFEEGATKYDPDGDGKGTAKPQLEDDPYLSVLAKGKGIRERLSLTPSTTDPMGEQVGLKVWGINIGPVVDRNGEIVEQTSLPDALKRGEVFRARPDNNVTFGNKVLTPEEQKTIITDESSIAHLVELPYKDTINGVVPDFDMIDKYKTVIKLLKNTTSNIQRTELLIKHGIDPSKLTIEDDGTWTLKTKMFTRMPGYISDDLVELNDNNKNFMDPIDKSEGNKKRKLFNRILKYGVQQPGKDAKPIHSTWDWFGGGDWDMGDMHRGYIYVTAPDEWLAALLTGQNKIDKHLLTDIDKRIYMSRAQQDSPLITQLP